MAATLAPLVDGIDAAVAEVQKGQGDPKANAQKLLWALDRFFDEVKGGGCDAEELRALMPRLVPTFVHTLAHANWHLPHTVSIGLTHVSTVLGPSVLELASTPIAPDPSLIDALLVNTRHADARGARELRDASAQVLGSFSRVAGNAAVSAVLPRLKEFVDSATSWEPLEGTMIALGYVGQCKDISKENFDTLFALLMTATKNSAHGDYSNYVRLQATRALERLVRPGSELPKEGYILDMDVDSQLSAATLTLLSDPEINVRKAASRLQRSHTVTMGHDSTAIVDKLVGNVAAAESWQASHGCALSLLAFCGDHSVVAQLSVEQVGIVFKALSELVMSDPHKSATAKDNASVTGQVNATAGAAAVALFLSLMPSTTPKSGVDALADGIAAISINVGPGGLEKVFEESMLGILQHLLSSDVPILLDAGGTGVKRIMIACEAIIKPHLPTLMCLVYKNRFHASMPIRDSAMKNWTLAAQRHGGGADAFLAEMSAPLLARLRQDAVASSAEVREAAFKALAELFAQPLRPDFLVSGAEGIATLGEIVDGTSNTKGGRFADEARAAAASALASFVDTHATTIQHPLASDASALDAVVGSSGVLPAVLRLLGETDADALPIGALKAIMALATRWTSAPAVAKALSTVSGPVLAQAYSSTEDIRYVAAPVAAALLGGAQGSVNAEGLAQFKSGDNVAAAAQGLVGAFGMDDDDAEEERREGVARAAAALVARSPVAIGSLPALAVRNLWRLAFAGTLLEDNRDSAIIQSHSLAVLAALVADDAAVAAVGPKRLAAYTHKVCALAAAFMGKEVEFDADALLDIDADADADDEDEIDADDEIALPEDFATKAIASSAPKVLSLFGAAIKLSARTGTSIDGFSDAVAALAGKSTAADSIAAAVGVAPEAQKAAVAASISGKDLAEAFEALASQLPSAITEADCESKEGNYYSACHALHPGLPGASRAAVLAVARSSVSNAAWGSAIVAALASAGVIAGDDGEVDEDAAEGFGDDEAKRCDLACNAIVFGIDDGSASALTKAAYTATSGIESTTAEDAPELWTWRGRVLAAAANVASTSALSSSVADLQAFNGNAVAKPLREVEEGVVSVAATSAAAALWRPDNQNPSALQVVADMLADEDITDAKPLLFEALVRLNAHADVGVSLPAPTVVDFAMLNEGFGASQGRPE